MLARDDHGRHEKRDFVYQPGVPEKTRETWPTLKQNTLNTPLPKFFEHAGEFQGRIRLADNFHTSRLQSADGLRVGISVRKDEHWRSIGSLRELRFQRHP